MNLLKDYLILKGLSTHSTGRQFFQFSPRTIIVAARQKLLELLKRAPVI